VCSASTTYSPQLLTNTSKVLQAWLNIEFQHFPEAEQFNVVIWRAVEEG